MAITRLIVQIAYLDGRMVSYPLTPKLQMTFEKFWHIGIGKLNDGPEGVTNVYKLAYHVQLANKDDFPGVMPGDLETWLDLVDGIEVENEEIVPFEKAALNGGSVPSQLPQESASVT